jgi:hypothetical protein
MIQVCLAGCPCLDLQQSPKQTYAIAVCLHMLLLAGNAMFMYVLQCTLHACTARCSQQQHDSCRWLLLPLLALNHNRHAVSARFICSPAPTSHPQCCKKCWSCTITSGPGTRSAHCHGVHRCRPQPRTGPTGAPTPSTWPDELAAACNSTSLQQYGRMPCQSGVRIRAACRTGRLCLCFVEAAPLAGQQ